MAIVYTILNKIYNEKLPLVDGSTKPGNSVIVYVYMARKQNAKPPL